MKESKVSCRISHELSHLLPFKTLMMQITINGALFSWDFIAYVVLFREIIKLHKPTSKWFSVCIPCLKKWCCEDLKSMGKFSPVIHLHICDKRYKKSG